MFTTVTRDLERSQEESVQQRLRSELRDILEQIREEIPGADIANDHGHVTIDLPDWYAERRQTKPAGESDSPVVYLP